MNITIEKSSVHEEMWIVSMVEHMLLGIPLPSKCDGVSQERWEAMLQTAKKDIQESRGSLYYKGGKTLVESAEVVMKKAQRLRDLQAAWNQSSGNREVL